MLTHMLRLLPNLFQRDSAQTDVALQQPDVLYDRVLLFVSLALMLLGLTMVASASIPIAQKLHGNPFHFTLRHAIYLMLSIALLLGMVRIPMSRWQQSNGLLLLLAIGLLVAVLIIGRKVNGSTRWLVLGPVTLQAAEPAKLFFFCYLAGYLVRRHDEVRENLKGFIKPLAVFFVLAVLLLAEPDLGTVVVMFVTTIGMLFLAGARLWQFIALVIVGLLSILALAWTSEYRWRRVTSFLDPWGDPFGSGYQLTQSLMAFGRGSWFGEGLGNSIQKLEYLPEAHTDFVVAVLAEELGLVGILLVLALSFVMVMRAMNIGNRALTDGRSFEGYLAYGIGIWLAFQAAVNIGAASGVMPTKGLTLPLVSYGGSSLLTLTTAVAILLRIDYELRRDAVQAMPSTKSGKSAKKVRRTRKKDRQEAPGDQQEIPA